MHDKHKANSNDGAEKENLHSINKYILINWTQFFSARFDFAAIGTIDSLPHPLIANLPESEESEESEEEEEEESQNIWVNIYCAPLFWWEPIFFVFWVCCYSFFSIPTHKNQKL